MADNHVHRWYGENQLRCACGASQVRPLVGARQWFVCPYTTHDVLDNCKPGYQFSRMHVLVRIAPLYGNVGDAYEWWNCETCGKTRIIRSRGIYAEVKHRP